jgi:hypothetical protein
MQKYATRGHDDIESASHATVPNPTVDRKRRCEKAVCTVLSVELPALPNATRKLATAECFLVGSTGGRYRMVE